MSGILFVVATPIGNLDDITKRAIDILNNVDVIFAESPRYSKRLLNHFSIDKKIYPYNDHNAKTMIGVAFDIVQNNKNIALITDAGTPTIQDPGFRIVKAFRENSIDVIPIPGASAFLVALVASGLPTDKFIFLGFLPKSHIRRRNMLKKYDLDATIILYESPKRLLSTLEDISSVFPNRSMVLAKEITKIHERFIFGTSKNVINQISEYETIKGEYVILIGKEDV